jgi:hypothetical protein
MFSHFFGKTVSGEEKKKKPEKNTKQTLVGSRKRGYS